jgi:hypothetical protein
MRPSALTLAAWLVALANCGGGERRSTSAPGASRSGVSAALSPIVELGTGQGAAQEFSGIAGAVTLGDGRVVVANGATNELRIFSEAGEHLATVGRRGRGPGEFNDLWWIGAAPGDTILAYDRQLRRLSVFAPSGEFVRSTRLDALLGWSGAVIGRFADGTLLLVSSTFSLPRERPPGFGRDTVELSRYDPRTGQSASFGRLPLRETYASGAGAGMVVFGVPLARGLHVVVCDSTILTAFSDSARVRELASGGRPVREIRFPAQERAVSAAERERLTRAAIEGSSSGFRPRIAAAYESGAAIPSTRPAFDALAGDASGMLWVALSADDPEAPSVWVRLAPNGNVVDTVRLAPRARIVSASGDRVVVVSRDPDDVEHVVVYRLPPVPARSRTAASIPDPPPAGCYRGMYSALGW